MILNTSMAKERVKAKSLLVRISYKIYGFSLLSSPICRTIEKTFRKDLDEMLSDVLVDMCWLTCWESYIWHFLWFKWCEIWN